MNATELTKALRQFNQDFEAACSGEGGLYVADGVVYAERYLSAPRKVLFFLKDCNVPDDRPLAEQRDLCESLRVDFEHGPLPPWIVPGQWAYGIQYAERRPSFGEANQTRERNIAGVSSAFMNPKKVGGGPICNMAAVKDFVIRHFKMLRKQLEMLDPDVVVLCGPELLEIATRVFPELRDRRRICSARIAGMDRSTVAYRAGRRVWLDHIHPAYYGISNQAKYEALLQAFVGTLTDPVVATPLPTGVAVNDVAATGSTAIS